MSRIGKVPVGIPKGVKAIIAGQLLKVEGPKGKLERSLRPEISAKVEGETIVFTRKEETQQARAFHGLERSLAQNMVKGVATGFEKTLQLIGVGYRADAVGKTLTLALGYSHTIDFVLPEGIVGTVIKEGRDTAIKLESANKELLGQVASKIRMLRPPEPYKGKGILYVVDGQLEKIKRKAGKSGKK